MWNILGIEPTKDIREIKRAYARLAKQYNPEEHPEEFKRIFDAYKSASALARSVNERRSDPIVTITAAAPEVKEQEQLQHEQHEQSEQTEFNFTSVDIFPDFEITPQLAQEKFLQNIALILSDKNKRDDISCWKWLLGKPTFLSVCDDKGFRKKAQKLLDKELLAPNVSSYIASRFSRGSRALPQKKGDKWAVYISHSGKNPGKLQGAKLYGRPKPASSHRSAAYDHGYHIFDILCSCTGRQPVTAVFFISQN